MIRSLGTCAHEQRLIVFSPRILDPCRIAGRASELNSLSTPKISGTATRRQCEDNNEDEHDCERRADQPTPSKGTS